MSASKVAMRKLRSSRKENNQCLRCGASLEGVVKTHCGDCAEYINQYNKDRRKKNKKAIRRLKTKAKNKKMYTVMQSKNITIKELAKHADVSERSVQRWILKGAGPRYKKTRELVNEKLGFEIFDIEDGY